MTQPIYVTSDGIYSDIDIYACTISYTELLNLQNIEAYSVINTTFTESITKEISSWKVEFINQKSFEYKPNNKYIILDRSDVENITKHISIDQIIEIFDHHFGYEEFWKNKLGRNSHIEPVGSCATLIWEEYKKKKLECSISITSAKLLYLAIISNTLDLKANVTTQRDIFASNELLIISELDKNYNKKYFNDLNTSVIKNPVKGILKDIKTNKYGDMNISIGQLELWNVQNIPTYLSKKNSKHI